MFSTDQAFSGFAVDDIPAARAFYGDVLGVDVRTNEMGFLDLHFANGHSVFVYGKEVHEPASFTILNFPVADIDAAMRDLRAKGVETKIYADDELATDDLGIARGMGGGPDIGWIRDPAGNVLAIIQA